MADEYVTMAVLRELLLTQERLFKQSMDILKENHKDEVNGLKRTIEELKQSLTFSQKDIDEVKTKYYEIDHKINGVEDTVYSNQGGIDELYDQQEYLENQSRRNNVKILGIPEKDPKVEKETWEESEDLALEAIKSKLKISEDLKIERAHRVGKTRPPFRHVGGRKVESQPRPIVVRFQLWKEKERVIKAARQIRPEGIKFFEDFSKRTLERRRQNIPELIKARKKGQKAFLVMDKLVIAPDKQNVHGDPKAKS